MGESKIFKCGFDIHDYQDILPSWREYVREDFIINIEEQSKGNIDKCVWNRHRPTYAESQSHEFRLREAKRILKTGAWIAIKEEVVWVPPSLYFAYQYGTAGSSDVQFRLKRVKHAYFKIRARNNPGCKGTMTIKNRGDGETTMAITDCFWECLDGNMDIGQIGIQSKTRNDAINPCWSYVQTLWNSLPQWLKSDLCSDFSSGKNIAEKMEWKREADEENNRKARNVLMQYYPSGTPMDGKHDMKKCLLDEICKWEECSFYDVFTNYSKFIMPGFERRGMFDMFSSPADKDSKSNREAYDLWAESNTDDIVPETGTTKSRVHRYYSDPLDGIHGAYDKFGDADKQQIYDHIIRERKKMPKDKLLAEIRGFPLNEEEMWGSMEGGDFWDNQKGINERKVYLMGTRFKNQTSKEPTVVYGNLEWQDGVKDEEPIFRMADRNEFNVNDARFCFSYLPKDQEPLKKVNGVWRPPAYEETVIGVDSVDKRYAGKGHSNFAMVAHKFRDVRESGIVKCPTGIYCCRPLPIEVSYEDAIKFAVFTRARVQVEALNSKIVDYFEDRGYIDWMLSKIGQPKNSLVKGDAPGGKTAFIDEIIGLLNAITNVPINIDDQYLMELNWFYELLDDVSKFNKADTHKNDLSMAWGQALLGAAKILFKKIRDKSSLNGATMEFLLN